MKRLLIVCILASGAAWAGSITVGSVINADTSTTAGTVTGGQSNDLAAAVAHTNRSDNPHVTTLQQSVNAGGGPVTNAPYLVQTNATDVTFAGWRFYKQLNTPPFYSFLQPAAGQDAYFRDQGGNTFLSAGITDRYLYGLDNIQCASFAGVFRVYDWEGGNGVAVHTTLTNHTAQLAGAAAITSGSAATNLWAGTAAQFAALSVTNPATVYFTW